MPDGRPAADAPEVCRAWEEALDAMELHLDEIRAGLEVGALPHTDEIAAPGGPLPGPLAARAVRLAAAQRDVEDLLRKRMAVLSLILSGTSERSGAAPAPAFIDRRS